MRYIFLVCLAVFAFPSYGAAGKAYVILKSPVLDDEKRQPTWIGFENKYQYMYVDARKLIDAVEPGIYHMSHIDFFDDQSNSGVISYGKWKLGRITFDRKSRFKFDADHIYFIGHIKLSNRKVHRFKMDIDQSEELIYEACRLNPDLFDKYPIASADGSAKVKFTCRDEDK